VPELPEVETVRRTLTPILGATITSVWDSGFGLHMNRRPPRRKLRKLVGAKITALRRIGKYLIIDTTARDSIVAHLGMTGRLRIHDARDPRAPHTHAVFGLGARELRFVDARRFGQIDVVTRGAERAHPSLKILGPDPLTEGIDIAALRRLAKKRKSSLKAFVLDQGVIAGVGNIYASEALWQAKLRPTKRANRTTAAQITGLVESIREVLDRALRNNGTSLRDFVDADGESGDNAEYLWVYGRRGEPCRRCKAKIKRSILQGRATYYCPTCQTP
jgi:formamidopyrimidine-DNA glycosylase